MFKAKLFFFLFGSVWYTASVFATGEVFDSTEGKESPFAYKTYESHILKGLEIGVQSMRVGEKAKILCDAKYGFKERGKLPVIPPDASLLFEVELVDIDESTAHPTTLDKIAEATPLKDEGNALFKEQQYYEALQKYVLALNHIDVPCDSDEDSIRLLAQLKISLHLNIAAAHMKLRDYELAIKNLQIVTKCEPMNPKAIYRLVQAYNGKTEFGEATLLL